MWFLASALMGALGWAAPPPAKAKVVSVYDGDTFTLDTGDRVRLRWVNTPEMKPPEPYAVEARELTKELVLNREVTLIYGATERDGYGRLVAGVRVGEVDLSTALLERGFGHLFIIPPDSTDPAPLITAQDTARSASRGIWSHDSYKGDLHITSFHANADGDDRENINGEYLRVCNVSTRPVDLAGFRLADASGKSWELPALLLPPGNTVKIHSGRGEKQEDPDQQLAIYLGQVSPIWNNKADQATIYDRYGKVVDSRAHQTDD